MEIRKKLIDFVISQRADSGLNRDEFAEAIGVSSAFWRRVEAGEKMISFESILRACEVLEIEIQLKVKRKSNWNPEQDAFLKENFSKGYEFLSNILGKKRVQVAARASRLGLTSPSNRGRKKP